MPPDGQRPERRRRRVLYRDGPLEAGPAEVLGERAHHLRNVLRAKRGDALVLFDGRGREADATILEVGRACVKVQLQAPRERPETPCALTVAVSMPKAARADWLVEKLSELGVQRLLWLRCERTDAAGRGKRPGTGNQGERSSRMRRWQRVAEEAAAQCGHAHVLHVSGPVDLGHLLEAGPATADEALALEPTAARLIADPSGRNPLLLTGDESPGRSVVVVVGPEGGLTRQELCKASEAGYTCVNLCPNILRVETAAVVGAALLLAIADSKGRQ